MNRLIKTILIISIFLPFASAQAQVDNLVVEFQQTPLFNEANFLPGGEITRWVKVTNNSGATQRIATEAINKNDPNRLGDVLNLEIKEGGVTRYNNSLSKFFAEGEVFLSELAGSEAQTKYDFIVSFYSGAQNPFQGKSAGFDILVGFQGTEGGLLPGAGSGGGGFLPPGLTIQNEATATTTATSVTIIWETSYPATSQVIYAKEGEKRILDLTDNIGTPPKYGYEYTTPEYDVSPKVIPHSVTITGLTSNTKYYYRTVSHASLAISEEHSFTTLKETPKEEELIVFIQPEEEKITTEEVQQPLPEVSQLPEVSEVSEVSVAKGLNPLLATLSNFITLGTENNFVAFVFLFLVLGVIVLLLLQLKKGKSGQRVDNLNK